MPTRLDEPMYRVLKAQALNIARIDDQVVIPGTDGHGNQVQLHGPRPNVIRLYDTPLRLYEDAALMNWERIVTLMPLTDDTGSRLATRTDRTLRYQVQFLVRLLDSEIAADRVQASPKGLRDNTLALKAHRLIYDWHHVFHDNMLLPDEDCEQGLVDDASYSLSWEPGVEYPGTLFSAEITATRSAW